MAIMESKKAGSCNVCRKPIEIGDLIDWNRTDGAKHHPKGGKPCEPVVASPEDRKAYQAMLLKALKEWDGIGSFRPMAYGDFMDLQKVQA